MSACVYQVYTTATTSGTFAFASSAEFVGSFFKLAPEPEPRRVKEGRLPPRHPCRSQVSRGLDSVKAVRAAHTRRAWP